MILCNRKHGKVYNLKTYRWFGNSSGSEIPFPWCLPPFQRPIGRPCHEGRERRDGDAEKRTVRRASADGRLRESGANVWKMKNGRMNKGSIGGIRGFVEGDCLLGR